MGLAVKSIVETFPKSVKPLADRIIIFPDPDDDTWDKGGLIHKPENKQFKKCQGTVVAVGDGKYVYKMNPENRKIKVKEVVMELVPGDRVCYNKYTGTEINFDVEGTPTEFMIMCEREILAKI